MRLTYLALAIATIALGLAVHLGGRALPADARDVLGDALWASMIVWLLSFAAPTAARAARGGAALAVCWAVEASQLHRTPLVDAIRATTIGHLILGSSFDPRDLAAYAGGVLLALLLERAAGLRRQAAVEGGVCSAPRPPLR